VELEDASVGLDGVPGVGAAIRPYDDIGVGRKGIRELAFALVTPLATHDDGRGHGAGPFSGENAFALLSIGLAAQGHQFPLQRNDLLTQLEDSRRASNVDAEVINQPLGTHEAVEISLRVQPVSAAPHRVYYAPFLVAEEGRAAKA
jgi:hypothetical protein